MGLCIETFRLPARMAWVRGSPMPPMSNKRTLTGICWACCCCCYFYSVMILLDAVNSFKASLFSFPTCSFSFSKPVALSPVSLDFSRSGDSSASMVIVKPMFERPPETCYLLSWWISPVTPPKPILLRIRGEFGCSVVAFCGLMLVSASASCLEMLVTATPC